MLRVKKSDLLQEAKDLNKDYLGTDYILKKFTKKFIRDNYKPSHILTFEDIYLFRPENFFKNLIKNIDNDFDSLVDYSD